MSRRLGSLTGNWPGANMVTLYLNSRTADFQTLSDIHPLLVPSRDAIDAIKTLGWHSVRRTPAPVSHWDDSKEHIEYHRFGSGDGFEPFVLARDFNDLKDPYVEVSEEFRLFHNLYHDQERQEYIKLDDSGQETVVVELRSDCVRFRVQEVGQYLAVREMHLLVQFDFQERSQHSLAELSLAEGDTTHHDEGSHWELHFADLDRDDYTGFARLIGKRLLAPIEKRYSGFPGFSEVAKRYADFVIGLDDQGGEIRATCNPTMLPSHSAEGPRFFTPVSFHKNVLERYFSQPSKFSVSDGLLSCGNLWMLEIDDDHDERVCVWLGDLGETLPYREQQHWQAHNFLPPDHRVSKTFFDRQFAAEFADSRRPEHQFRDLYRQLAETSEQRLGWPVLKPLRDKDAHRLTSVRVPASGEQPAFDDQVQGLATILVDSLNKRCLRDLIPQAERPERDGSIDLLETLFRTRGIHDYHPHIGLLRTVQNLRSSGSAHRKGREYEKHAAKVRLAELGPPRVVADLINQANGLLRFLIAVVDSDTMAH